ncbi:UPF0158 family protein [Fictibacillus phosphorivorans]|uniref:UPF0158 family protein n=1 Tax=Fictibacillus phosphorivorans TaxID=1221500 RepID=UPI00204148A9|nr:UPF0158 family protein [Fictibacillus phosphorivorans]MCM3720138.1 UPF0158 family protein [Fictibacillus phosphorivorans]MCM3777798.1 UPF0158 family protein [Fictibacillus phosphorivorans]
MFIEKLMVAYMDNAANHIYYLDKNEQVILLDAIEPGGLPNLEFLDADEPDRFIEIPKVMNVESFSWMVEFESQNQHTELLHALNENNPFERFNETIEQLNLTEKWQAFQKEKVKSRIESWLSEKQIKELEKQLD